MKRFYYLSALFLTGLLVLSSTSIAADARVGSIMQFNLPPPRGLEQITAGPDGNIWFTDSAPGRDYIGRITPSGTLTTFPLPEPVGGCQCLVPYAITAGPDGNLWFTLLQTGQIGMITPDGSTINVFTIPPVQSVFGPIVPDPQGIASGPDGNVWFTGGSGEFVGFLNPSTVGNPFFPPNIVEYALPDQSSCLSGNGGCEHPQAITRGPDGAMWFTSANLQIGVVTRITVGGAITQQFQIPGAPEMEGIATGSDGNLWFTAPCCFSPPAVDRLTPSGKLTTFAVPSNQIPEGIAAGPDNALWVAGGSQTNGAIDRVTVRGKVTVFPVPNVSGFPTGITTGPITDRATIWVTDPNGNNIDVISTK